MIGDLSPSNFYERFDFSKPDPARWRSHEVSKEYLEVQMIEGVSHMTFVVKDLTRMSTVLETVFDAREIYWSGDETHSIAREKFFMVGDVWIAIMEGDSLLAQTYNHIAFKIPETSFDEYRKRILKAGLELLPARSRISGEAQSLYFYDHDNHLFELHTGTLADRLKAYSDHT